MSNLIPIRLAMTHQGIDFEESIRYVGIKITFGIYGIDGSIKTAFFIDSCKHCPIHGNSNSEDQKNKFAANSKLVSEGLIVIRCWSCLVAVSPDKIVERLKFSVSRPRNLKAYCSILRPKGVGI